jgi:hypothetical protein
MPVQEYGQQYKTKLRSSGMVLALAGVINYDCKHNAIIEYRSDIFIYNCNMLIAEATGLCKDEIFKQT